MKNLTKTDPKLAKIIRNEIRRQQNGLVLIASENFASQAVLKALGSPLTNKYSEGYPGRRYYGGNQFIDEIENLAIERAKKLFLPESEWKNWQVNVQPYSGSPANFAVYAALLQPGDKLMGMTLSHGGHLTHGHKVSFSGKFFTPIQYGLDPKTHLLNYEEILKLAKKEKPKIIVCGYTAYPRKIDFKKFGQIAKKVNAILMADIAHLAGLIAARVYPSPFPYADVVTMTTHKTLRGPRGAIIFAKNKYAEAINKAVFPGLQGGPHDNNTAAIAVALGEALKPSFRKYARQIINNARALVKSLEKNGLKIISGGTDSHLLLIDLTETGIFGREAEKLLEEVCIYVNRNTIPYDQRSPFDPSGLRLGTPALTTRGMKEKEMKLIGKMIAKIILNPKSKKIKKEIKKEVQNLTKKFPLYQNL
ncbi:MAG: serine hydroxymethyltransferase [Patescibacteria group bacterium]|nr:serine hydroxymethyltransferase [Patescibacteria group bacterium]